MKDVLNGFKEFIMRGNVVELAVAFVIGTAFAKLINTVVSAVITPIIAVLFRESSLSGVLSFTINGAQFRPGAVADAIISFLIVAAVVYFVIVLPVNKFSSMRKRGIEPEPQAPAEDVLLLQEIRDLLASQQGTTPPPPPRL